MYALLSRFIYPQVFFAQILSLGCCTWRNTRRVHVPVTRHVFKPEPNRNHDIGGDQKGSLQPISGGIRETYRHRQNCQHIENDFKMRKVEGHVPVKDPSHNDNKGDHKQRDLRTGTHSNSHGQIHLVLDGNGHCRHVLHGIADNRNDDETHKRRTDTRLRHKAADAVHEKLRKKGDCHGRTQETQHGHSHGEFGIFVVFIVK
mmetsp:Transcript_12853/g.29917  ORF Transcript_12853/g.29917 Transcript_12853/m.29917 type:complete len:202 (-) Transcript_12853:1107-1712(-)